MKKKMLFMAAIAGLISLGSCVKDDVSSSVEAVRNAKANQLNADANWKNAQAAVQQAAAELAKATQSALVAQEQASAAILQAQAQKDQLDADFDAQAFAAKLEATLADYADKTATSNVNVQLQLNALAAAVRAASTAENTDIKNAITEFSNAYANYVSKKKNVVTKQLTLDNAKVDYEHAQAANAVAIRNAEKEIAKQTAILEALEKIESEGMTFEEAQAAKNAVDAEITSLKSEFDAAPEIASLLEAAEAWVAAYVNFKGVEGAFTALNNQTNGTAGSEQITDLNIGMSYYTAPTAQAKTAKALTGFEYGNLVAYQYNAAGIKYNKIDDAEGNNIQPANWKQNQTAYDATYTLSEGAKARIDDKLDVFTEKKENDVTDETGILGKAGDKSDTKYTKTDGVTKVSTKYALLEAAKEALQTAKDDAAAVKTATDAEATAKKAKDDAVAALGNPADDKTKNTAYGKQAKATADLADATTALSADSGSDPAVTAALTKAVTDANTAKTVADANVTLAQAEVTTKTAAYNDAVTATAKAKADHPQWAADQTTLANNITDAEYDIEDQKDKITKAKADLATAEEDLDNIKAMIAAADVEAYEAAIDDLNEAAEAFNEAAAAVKALKDVIEAKEAESTALGAATVQNIEDQIATAKQTIATQEKILEKLQNGLTEEQMVANLQADLDQAEVELVAAEARLAAAQKRIDDLNIEIDLDGDDEPAEEPADDPSEEPAEGGEETPAEGEGEAEGGEEA